MASSGLLPSFLSAIQASLSVLLVISYGALATHFRLLDSSNGKAISRVCVKLFLPALLLVHLGSEMRPSSAYRYLVVFLWALIAHGISFLLGVFGRAAFGLPDWIACAIMFNNTTSYPLLLVQSLEETGLLAGLGRGGEEAGDMVGRAKSYFLIFSTVSSCLTFAVGPRLTDGEHEPEVEEHGEQSSVEGTNGGNRDAENGSTEAEEGDVSERTGLLGNEGAWRKKDGRGACVASLTFFGSHHKYNGSRRRPHYIPHPKWSEMSPRTKWWLLFLYDFLNAPLVGAVLGAIIGLVTPLHRAFFNDTFDGGFFSAWLTESWKNVGQIFVPLPLIVAGISLYTAYQESKQAPDGGQSTRVPWLTTTFILVCRFVLWPAMSIAVIYGLVKADKGGKLLGDDPMLWFSMMLMPTGPPAMKLITMVQVAGTGNEDEQRIAKILTISYVVSPILAFTVVGSMLASKAAI